MILIRKDQFPEGFLCEDIASVLLCICDTHFNGSDLENIVKNRRTRSSALDMLDPVMDQGDSDYQAGRSFFWNILVKRVECHLLQCNVKKKQNG